MAFVPGFVHDVFVSYAHNDNAPDLSGNGWVSQFVTCLDAALCQRLGHSDDVRVFFDARQLHSNQQLDELLAAARESATFLAIASRSYATRDWTNRELGAFVEQAADPHRLFAVECLPLDEGETYPSPLQNHKHIEFWQIDAPHSQTPIPLSPVLNSQSFLRRVHDLAEQIRRQLVILRGVALTAQRPKPIPPATPRVATTPAPAYAGMRRVLLAQVTDDLEDDRQQVRRYLQQFGIPVLPEDTYPQDGHRFCTAFEADLSQADLFVQLLGAYPGRAPPDLPEGYTRFQLAAAKASASLEIMQWRRPDLNPEAVTNPQQREMLSGEHVIASGLEAFKADVLRRATRAPTAIEKAAHSSLVFIDADRDDLEIAKRLQKAFVSHALGAAVPSLSGPAEEIRADLEENLIDCDALVLVYGQSTPLWVRGQLRLYNKLRAKRSAPPRILAIYTGPPEEKQDLGFDLPEIQHIDARNAVGTEPVLPLIAALSK